LHIQNCQRLERELGATCCASSRQRAHPKRIGSTVLRQTEAKPSFPLRVTQVGAGTKGYADTTFKPAANVSPGAAGKQAKRGEPRTEKSMCKKTCGKNAAGDDGIGADQQAEDTGQDNPLSQSKRPFQLFLTSPYLQIKGIMGRTAHCRNRLKTPLAASLQSESVSCCGASPKACFECVPRKYNSIYEGTRPRPAQPCRGPRPWPGRERHRPCQAACPRCLQEDSPSRRR